MKMNRTDNTRGLSVERFKTWLFKGQELRAPSFDDSFCGADFFVFNQELAGPLTVKDIDFEFGKKPPNGYSIADYGLFADNSLTPIGRIIQEKLKGSTLVDLGCGFLGCNFARYLTQIFGGRRYIGVDNQEIKKDSVRKNEFKEVIPSAHNFRSYFISADMKEFLKAAQFKNSAAKDSFQETRHKRLVFLLNAIEEGDYSMQSYIGECLSLISNKTQPGDIIILSGRTKGFQPDRYGFKQIAGLTLEQIPDSLRESCGTIHGVRVFEKSGQI